MLKWQNLDAVTVLDTTSNSIVHTFEGRISGYVGPGIDEIAVENRDGSRLDAFNPFTGEFLRTIFNFPERGIMCGFSPNGELLAYMDDKTVRVVEVKSLMTVYETQPVRGYPVVRFSLDGERIAIGSLNSLEIHTLLTHDVKMTPLDGTVRNIQFLTDGRIFVATDRFNRYNSSSSIYSIGDDVELLFQITGHLEFALSPDTRIMVVTMINSNQNSIYIGSPDDPLEIELKFPHRSAPPYAFSPHSSIVVIGADVYSTDGFKYLRSLPFSDPIHDIEFFPETVILM
jgi:hypothetical protein